MVKDTEDSFHVLTVNFFFSSNNNNNNIGTFLESVQDYARLAKPLRMRCYGRNGNVLIECIR